PNIVPNGTILRNRVCRSGQLSNKTLSCPLTGNLCTKYLKKTLRLIRVVFRAFYRIRRDLIQEHVPQCGTSLAGYDYTFY
ncbi:MAG: hypothetical protein WA992_01980, partial [Desulfobulbales bacterium]